MLANKRKIYTKLKSIYISEEQNEWLIKNSINFSQWIRNKIDLELEHA